MACLGSDKIIDHESRPADASRSDDRWRTVIGPSPTGRLCQGWNTNMDDGKGVLETVFLLCAVKFVSRSLIHTFQLALSTSVAVVRRYRPWPCRA